MSLVSPPPAIPIPASDYLADREQAAELLMGSYVLAAHRIMEVLGGRLTIANARPDAQPLNDVGLVLGLCGQGGRHPYFSLPKAALEWAVSSILMEDSNASPFNRQLPSNRLDRLVAICSILRRAATF